MGYAYYVLSDGREAGYGVEAECDRPGCDVRIDRGLGYLCGSAPDGWRDPNEPGCGDYFCTAHGSDHDCPNPPCESWDETTRSYCRLARHGTDEPHRFEHP